MALADLVEPLGFDTLWTFEQHAAPYIMIPDPNQYLSYFAGRTKRIDVGSMIVVLHVAQPVPRRGADLDAPAPPRRAATTSWVSAAASRAGTSTR